MSDGKKPEEAGDGIKDAVPDGKAAPGGLLPSKEMTFSQRLFIWTMVILVGVVFGGVGSTFGSMSLTGRTIDGVDALEIERVERLAARLQEAINPAQQRGSESFVLQAYEGQRKSPYVAWLRQAHLAFSEGYKPTAPVTEQLVKDFLARTVVASEQDADQGKRTYFDVLVERRAKDRVSPDDLGWYLAMRHAIRAMHTRRLAVPVVPTAVADDVRGLGDVTYMRFGNYQFPREMPGDQVQLDQVTLSAQVVAADGVLDEAELQAAYDRLRTKERFLESKRAVVAVAYLDIKAALDKAKPTAEQVQKHYEANKKDYKKPAAPKPDDKKPDAAKPEDKKTETKPDDDYTPLAEVRGEIEKTLAAKTKVELIATARKNVAQFAQRLSDDGFDEKDQAAFVAAAERDGLSIKENVVVVVPGADGIELPGMGKIEGGDGRARLFASESKPGFITAALRTQGDDGTALVMRLAEVRPAQVRALSDPAVRKEVSTYLAGRKAWDKLLVEAKTLRDEAAKLGAGGLRKRFEDAALRKRWTIAEVKDAAAPVTDPPPAKDKKDAKDEKDTLVTETTVAALTEFAAPPESLDQPAVGDRQTVAALAVPTWPVLLVEGDSTGDVPTVRLVQATRYVVPGAAAADRRDDLAQRYRTYWFNYQARLLGREIDDRLKE